MRYCLIYQIGDNNKKKNDNIRVGKNMVKTDMIRGNINWKKLLKGNLTICIKCLKRYLPLTWLFYLEEVICKDLAIRMFYSNYKLETF